MPRCAPIWSAILPRRPARTAWSAARCSTCWPRARPDLSIGAITRLQRLKTGALISFSCTAGAILGKASDPLRNALSAYAHDLGLAFQIVDDLLDIEGNAAELGKTPGKDAAAGKATFVSILGLERARAQAAPAGATGRRASRTVRRGRGFAKAGGEIRCRAAGVRGRAGV